jgi:hypothetical protein
LGGGGLALDTAPYRGAGPAALAAAASGRGAASRVKEVPMTVLTAAVLALCLQDDAAEMKWTILEGDRFDLKWTFNEARRREGQDKTNESHDKRDVEAELAWKAEGILSLTLKRVVWSYGSHEYEIGLTYVEGKKLDPKMSLKIQPKDQGYAVVKAEADRMFEYMKKLTDGEFTVNTIDDKGRTMFLWNNGNVRQMTPSLLDKIFTHPLLPSGPVRVGQLFKDPFEVTNLPPGLIDVKQVESKVTAVGDKGLVAKGGLTVPFGKTFTANSQVQNMSGTFTYTCEWNYHPKQYLQRSAEESKLAKKIDAKGKDADFYKENLTHSYAQVLTIKKKEPKPGDKKPEEKKAEQK